MCPALRDQVTDIRGWVYRDWAGFMKMWDVVSPYAGNYRLYDDNNWNCGKKLADVRRPAEVFHMVEGGGDYFAFPGYPDYPRQVVYPHDNGCSVGFVDGHARWLSREEILGKWDNLATEAGWTDQP